MGRCRGAGVTAAGPVTVITAVGAGAAVRAGADGGGVVLGGGESAAAFRGGGALLAAGRVVDL